MQDHRRHCYQGHRQSKSCQWGSQIAALKELDRLDGNESFANFKSFHVALISDYLTNAIRADAAYKKAYQDAGSSLRVTQAYGNYLERNGRYARLLREFKRQTGRGVLVNTSFNVRGEPIVCTPEDAWRCFRACDMDVLVLENHILRKDEQPPLDESERSRHMSRFQPD